MRALVYDGDLTLKEIPMPEPGLGEALIRVTTAGICNTDLEICKGYMGFQGVLGHEFVGVVEHPANPHLLGKRVVGEINCVCGTCRYCQLELPHHCLNRSVLGIQNRNGAFAQFLCLPEENLHIVPNSLRDDVAVFTEPLAAAFRILEQVNIQQNDRVIVLGDGKLGQLIAQTLWLSTKHLVCVGRHSWKLGLLKRLGINTAREDEPVEPGVDYVIEATGAPESLARALELVRPEGTVILKTTAANLTPMDLTGPVINEIRILGSRCGPFRPALEALAMGNVEVRPMVSADFPLEEGVAAFEQAATKDSMKVLLHM